MTAIRLGRERLTAVSNGFADLISGTCGRPAVPNGLLNGSVFGNDMGSLSAKRSGLLMINRGAVRLGLPQRTLPVTMPRLSISDVPQFADTSANVTYFASAVSCTFALLTAALTAPRNESALAGTCTSPDSVLRKETSLP